MEELIKLNKNPEFREYMSKEEDERKIQNSLLNESYNSGMINGIKEGEKTKPKEIAKNMLSKNIDINAIIECTGLTKEEIENLK